jgi:hypothetical protein
MPRPVVLLVRLGENVIAEKPNFGVSSLLICPR